MAWNCVQAGNIMHPHRPPPVNGLDVIQAPPKPRGRGMKRNKHAKRRIDREQRQRELIAQIRAGQRITSPGPGVVPRRAPVVNARRPSP